MNLNTQELKEAFECLKRSVEQNIISFDSKKDLSNYVDIELLQKFEGVFHYQYGIKHEDAENRNEFNDAVNDFINSYSEELGFND